MALCDALLLPWPPLLGGIVEGFSGFGLDPGARRRVQQPAPSLAARLRHGAAGVAALVCSRKASRRLS